MRHYRVLLVVDGWFSLGPQDRNDRSFSVSHLIHALKTSTSPKIFLDTAHRDGNLDATIYGKFRFDDPDMVRSLDSYDEIWLFGYNGANSQDPLNVKNKVFLKDTELRVLSEYMDRGGGILASGDHESLGSFMCGKVPRVRTMRKWFRQGDPFVPKGAPYNWPVSGPDRADTLQKDVNGDFHFTNQSDDLPQPLELVPIPGLGAHPIFNLGGRTLEKFPDHFHEGEVLGFGGVEGCTPWTMDDALTFDGKTFQEYPSKNGNQEVPRIIARGQCIGGHPTSVENGKLCDSGFDKDDDPTNEKQINILSSYDGHKVDVGRVITDSSFHHFADLNLIGDPCALEEKTRGLSLGFLNDMDKFLINLVVWLARPDEPIA